MTEQATDIGINDSFVTFKDVKAAINLSRATIYKKISEGTFPPPVKCGRASRWSTRELKMWMDARRQERVHSAA